MRRLFEDAGFVTELLSTKPRLVENRKMDLKMDRLFVQGVFVLREGHAQTRAGSHPTEEQRAAAAMDAPAAELDSLTQSVELRDCHGLEWDFQPTPTGGQDLPEVLAAALCDSVNAASLTGARVLEWGSRPGVGAAAMLALRQCRCVARRLFLFLWAGDVLENDFKLP